MTDPSDTEGYFKRKCVTGNSANSERGHHKVPSETKFGVPVGCQGMLSILDDFHY